MVRRANACLRRLIFPRCGGVGCELFFVFVREESGEWLRSADGVEVDAGSFSLVIGFTMVSLDAPRERSLIGSREPLFT
ncbi:hypothetical protein DB347_19160 [Opitutaceae bacterium EW11]|nr:hypothetical protein DB347_19160 [Opitutaceae bacterium EW11]